MKKTWQNKLRSLLRQLGKDYDRPDGAARDRAIANTEEEIRRVRSLLDFHFGKSAKSRSNPSRRLTKAQKRVNASKRSKQKRMSDALRKFLKTQNPAARISGASVVKLKGGVLKITPIIERKRGGRR